MIVSVRCLLPERPLVQVAVAQVPDWFAAMLPVMFTVWLAPVPAAGAAPRAKVYARLVAASVTEVESSVMEVIGSVLVQRILNELLNVAAVAWKDV